MNQLDVINGGHLTTTTGLQNSTVETSVWIQDLYTHPRPVYLLEVEIRNTGCKAGFNIWHTPEELDTLIANLQAHREHIKNVQTELIALQSAPKEQAA